ncbi:E3 ubiquitin-protein transferase MAEA [Hydra vulgaris]|uniref:E3 ubiquitin-protein transferase MAEA n=1 Tax=Hydra vulgaris TaxID=6087 RepID=UPI001F5FC80A|nr:E3 ubiquitin-protein transferase MAEA [Hydra vulgaris]
MSNIKSLEYSTLIVPYELLNKTFRNAQKVIDREVSHVNSTSDKLKKVSSKNKVSIEEVTKEFDVLLEHLTSLKEKSIHCVDQEEVRLNTCQQRLEHVSKNQSSTAARRNLHDRMLVNYFLHCGYHETAIQLAEKSFVKEYVDLDVFLVARDIEKSLKEKNPALCLQWCHANKSKLKKLQSTLELNVRVQEFIELVKNNQRLQAVLYSRKHFGSLSDVTDSYKLQKTVMAILAFKVDTEVKRYKDLFSDTRWDLLVEQFRKENFALHQLDSQSIMEVVLQCGLASLKTPHCFHKEEQCQDCPVCNRLFNTLSKPLPFAHSSQSRLICSISGEQMNEHNHPLMLPNGYVYGERSIQSLLSEGNGDIICPKTKDTYSVKDLKKVFIM